MLKFQLFDWPAGQKIGPSNKQARPIWLMKNLTFPPAAGKAGFFRPRFDLPFLPRTPGPNCFCGLMTLTCCSAIKDIFLSAIG